MWRPVRYSWRPAAWAVLIVSASLADRAVVHAQGEPEVEILGGADKSGHNYVWTITHRHQSPLVAVEFPHFGADLFTAPPGWSVECEGLVGKPGSNHRGVCRAEAEDEGSAVRRHRPAEFIMRIAPSKQPRRGQGTVTLRFADGSTLEPDYVELPLPEPLGDQFVPLIGLAVIFGGFLLTRVLRRRRLAAAATEAGDNAPPAA